ncbi:hypothetical protein AGMMS49965_23820 [Bacteroidia bacterium]|nr:hypothetical protein AGMMS49965_23820 [Bacteroidia bacterium]
MELDNETPKQILMDLTIGNIPVDGICINHRMLTNPYSTDSVVFKKAISPSDVGMTVVTVKLYNISDTTLIMWDYYDNHYLDWVYFERYDYDYDLTDFVVVTQKVWRIAYIVPSIEEDEIHTYTLSPNEELFEIMQKDYSMLEKFSEYYK